MLPTQVSMQITYVHYNNSLSFEKESKLKKHDKLAKYENENSSNSKELAFAFNQIATTERQSLLLSLSYELSEVPSPLL